MERSTRLALWIAGATVFARLPITQKPASVIGQAFFVGFALLLIVFPAAMESGFRNSYRSRAHGGYPAPDGFVKTIGWIILIAIAIGTTFQLAQRAL